MKIFVTAGLAFLLVYGCATPKEWTATSGSRSDGIVKLSYDQYELESPILNEQQAIDIATKRCSSWGYTSAEAFGGVTRRCNQFGGLSGCSHFTITKEFQCTNAISDALITSKTLTSGQPVTFGIQHIGVNKQLSDTLKMKSPRGVYVVAVIPSSTAERSGVQQGDVILRIGDKEILAPDDVPKSLSNISPKSKLPVTIWRNGTESILFAVF